MSGRPPDRRYLWRRSLAAAPLSCFVERHPSGRRVKASTQKLVGEIVGFYLSENLEAWMSTARLASGRGRSHDELQPHTALSARTVTDALDCLVLGGWLSKVAEREATATVYRAAIPRAAVETLALQPLQGALQPLQEGLKPLQGGSAAAAPEVENDLELQAAAEVVPEDGAVQLALGAGRPRSVDGEVRAALAAAAENGDDFARLALDRLAEAADG